MPPVAPLREFVEHILRASNATYTTLLAALYYLQLLRSQSPQEGCTTEQSCGIASPLQCRRRMFLAALMLDGSTRKTGAILHVDGRRFQDYALEK